MRRRVSPHRLPSVGVMESTWGSEIDPTHKINLILSGYIRVKRDHYFYFDSRVTISVQKEYHVVVSILKYYLHCLYPGHMHVVSYSHSASIQSVIELELNGHACLYIGNSINKIDQYTMYICLVRFLCDYWSCLSFCK